MRRALWGSVIAAVAALLGMAGFAVFQLARGLSEAEAASRQRMQALAAYIVEHLREDAASYSFVLSPQSLPEEFLVEKSAWLRRLAEATGLQRVALTDSAGLVYISSFSGLPAGTRIRDSLADAEGFDRARRGSQAVFAKGRGAASSQALYFPFDHFGTVHMLTLESDRNLLRQFGAFRSFTEALSLALVLALGTLVAAIVFLDRRAQAALAASRRNEQLAFLGRASAELAHELKNPLAVIKASGDVLRRRFDPEGRDPAFAFLAEESMRMGRVISDVLGLSRGQKLECSALDLEKVLEPAAASMGAAFPQMKIDLRVSSGLRGWGHAEAARRIGENLLRNAAQAMDGKGRVALRGRAEGDKVGLWMADDGPGVPPGLRRDLFDPFVSGSGSGTGLGLAIVKDLCERMGWTVRLAAEAEARAVFPEGPRGACFHLEIPAPPLTKTQGG